MSKTMSAAQRMAHREVLWRRQNGLCSICKCSMKKKDGFDNSATIDHVIPKSKGGPNARWNLALACKKCNTNKGNAWMEEVLDSGELKSPADGVLVQVQLQAP